MEHLTLPFVLALALAEATPAPAPGCQTIEIVIEVGAPNAPRPPAPRPPPKPAPRPAPPPAPTNRFGLMWIAFGLAEQPRQTLTPAQLLADAGAMARAFRAAAAAPLADPAAYVHATSTAVHAAQGPHLAAWKSFNTQLDIVLSGLAEQGRLVTSADHAQAWLEIAAGLEMVK